MSSTITVSLSGSSLQYSPSNLISVPRNTTTTVTWTIKPGLALSFIASTIQVFGADAASVTIQLPGPNNYINSFDVTIVNGSGQSLDAAVAFQVASQAGGGGGTINGGGTIRNKGTSIWAWELVFTLVGLVIGGVLGYRFGASGPQFGPLLVTIAGVLAGGLGGYMLRGMRR